MPPELSLDAALQVAYWLINATSRILIISAGTTLGTVVLMWVIGYVKELEWL